MQPALGLPPGTVVVVPYDPEWANLFEAEARRLRAALSQLTRLGSQFWREHLAFRDYLRTQFEARDAYSRLKYGLAARFPTDRERYIEGKGPFIRSIVNLALQAAP